MPWRRCPGPLLPSWAGRPPDRRMPAVSARQRRSGPVRRPIRQPCRQGPGCLSGAWATDTAAPNRAATQPLIDYYKKQGILKEVDGSVDMEDVFKEILKILGV